MEYVKYIAIALFCIASVARGDHSVEEENPVPIPYSFSYAAGRQPGHVDRVHAETSDGTGVIRGMFSYIDPRYKIRTVEYVADRDGFHPILITNPVSDTSAVAKAKEKHQVLFNKIAAQHQKIALERGQTFQEETTSDDGKYTPEAYAPNPNIVVEHPRDTPIVENAKVKNYNLYSRIAEEHARIAEEHARIAAERKAGNPDGGEVLFYQH